MIDEYSETETWFIAGPDDLQFDGWKKGKFFKRVAKCTPWKKIILDYSKYPKFVSTEAHERKYIEYKYTEISKKEFLEHKCIDCWHPHGVEHSAARVPEISGVGDDC